jgi:hypothetical protein
MYLHLMHASLTIYVMARRFRGQDWKMAVS